MFTLLLFLMLLSGIILCKVGWKKENKKNKCLYAGVLLIIAFLLLVVLAIILGAVVFAFKIAWGMIAAFFFILWKFKLLLLLVVLVAAFCWLKNRWGKRNKSA